MKTHGLVRQTGMFLDGIVRKLTAGNHQMQASVFKIKDGISMGCELDGVDMMIGTRALAQAFGLIGNRLFANRLVGLGHAN